MDMREQSPGLVMIIMDLALSHLTRVLPTCFQRVTVLEEGQYDWKHLKLTHFFGHFSYGFRSIC